MFIARLFVLGVCVYFCPPLFGRLAARWYPDEFVGKNKPQQEHSAGILRARFWRTLAMIACTIGAVLLLQWWWRGDLGFDASDWLRVAAASVALTAALGRGGWGTRTPRKLPDTLILT